MIPSPLIKVLIPRKTDRSSSPSEYKVNGPVGIRLDISSRVYIKGICVYSDLDPLTLKTLELSNPEILGHPLSLKFDDTSELVSKLFHPYWSPTPLPSGDTLIPQPPSYSLLSLFKHTSVPHLPLAPSSSLLIFPISPLIPPPILSIQHFTSLPPSLSRYLKHNSSSSSLNSPLVSKLNRILYEFGPSI